jgi:hypothetical protein
MSLVLGDAEDLMVTAEVAGCAGCRLRGPGLTCGDHDDEEDRYEPEPADHEPEQAVPEKEPGAAAATGPDGPASELAG